MDTRRFRFAQPEWLGEVASTSDVLKERLRLSPAPPIGAVVAARRQTKGRGRMGAGWQSSAEGDLLFSFHWSGDAPPLQAGSLPMACALGVGDFLAREPWRIESLCKWPNDVMVGDTKICGILAEGGQTPDGAFGLVIGIGVNLRRVPGRDHSLGRKTASVEDFAGPVEDAATLLPILLASLETRISAWESGGFAALRPELERRLWGKGREISAKTAHGPTHGRVAGLGPQGELLLTPPASIASIAAIESGW